MIHARTVHFINTRCALKKKPSPFHNSYISKHFTGRHMLDSSSSADEIRGRN